MNRKLHSGTRVNVVLLAYLLRKDQDLGYYDQPGFQICSMYTVHSARFVGGQGGLTCTSGASRPQVFSLTPTGIKSTSKIHC